MLFKKAADSIREALKAINTNPCTIGEHEERRKWRLFYRRNHTARYALQNPHKFDRIYTVEGYPLHDRNC